MSLEIVMDSTTQRQRAFLILINRIGGMGMLDDWYRLKRFVQLTHQLSILLKSGKPLLDMSLDILRSVRSKSTYLMIKWFITFRG